MAADWLTGPYQGKDTMKRSLFAIPIALFLMICLCLTTWAVAPKDEGTPVDDLAGLRTIIPSQTKVVVLPLWDYTSNVSHQRVATAAVFQHFQYQGFDVMPALAGFAAMSLDKELEPGLPLRKADAMRIGKTTGAKWVVYGEVKELRVYEKNKIIGSSKKIVCSMRLAVADCETNEVIYWRVRSDTLGDTGFSAGFSRRKSTKLIRVGVQSVSERIFSDLFASVAKHDTKGAKPNDSSLLEIEKSLWPDGGD